jgi:tetratricopeptide (TPR) repeat protein
MGDKWGIAFSSEELGYIMISQGDYGRAEALFEESLALWRETGNKGGTANSLDYLGLVALSQGDYDRAVVLCKESLSLFREVGIKWTISGCLEVLAGVAGAGGQPERAARLFGAAEAIREAIGSSMQIPRRDSYDRNVAAIRAQLSEEAFRAAWEEGRKMTMEEAVQLAGGSEQ